MEVLVTRLCATLCDPVDCSLPGSSVRGIFQARILEWIAIPFSRVSSWPRDQTQVSCIAGRFFTVWATREVPHYLHRKPASLLTILHSLGAVDWVPGEQTMRCRKLVKECPWDQYFWLGVDRRRYPIVMRAQRQLWPTPYAALKLG